MIHHDDAIDMSLLRDEVRRASSDARAYVGLAAISRNYPLDDEAYMRKMRTMDCIVELLSAELDTRERLGQE